VRYLSTRHQQTEMTQSKMQVVYCDDGLLHNPPIEMTLGQIKPYVGKYPCA